MIEIYNYFFSSLTKFQTKKEIIETAKQAIPKVSSRVYTGGVKLFYLQGVKLDAGKISHEVAETLALTEYEKYKKTQDKNYISDFDREIKKLLAAKAKKR